MEDRQGTVVYKVKYFVNGKEEKVIVFTNDYNLFCFYYSLEDNLFFVSHSKLFANMLDLILSLIDAEKEVLIDNLKDYL